MAAILLARTIPGGDAAARAAWCRRGAAYALAQLASVLVPSAARAAGEELAGISPFATLGKLLAALALVLVVFWVCAHLMRRLQGLRNGALPGALRVVGALPLGARERLVVVQAGEEQLLLGVTASRIERLHLLATPLDTSRQDAGGTQAGDTGGEFGRRLLAALDRNAASQPERATGSARGNTT